MKKVVDSIKYIHFVDLLSPFVFLLALPFALLFRCVNFICKRELWLVCESGDTARDNGYYFYKYVRENHPKDFCFYVIDKKSNDFQKVQKYGHIISFKSFQHWIYYLAANYNISSQKHGNPNQPFFYVVHVIMKWFNNRVFLQHGVIKDMCDWLTYPNTRFQYFICGAKREYEYVTSSYGYPEGSVLYTGLSRFDNLHDFHTSSRQILIMPTWRNWLGRETNKLQNSIDFRETAFYQNWNALLNDDRFIQYIEKNHITVLFYPHINMQKYLRLFTVGSPQIQLVDLNTDIQKTLKESALLITDYSSVFMDFGYMKKPILYFQFDREEYRKKQYTVGYFDYQTDGFGPILENVDDVVSNIIQLHQNKFEADSVYKQRMSTFFELHDTDNSKRIYDILKERK